jgi:hypothetical protein
MSALLANTCAPRHHRSEKKPFWLWPQHAPGQHQQLLGGAPQGEESTQTSQPPYGSCKTGSHSCGGHATRQLLMQWSVSLYATLCS